MTDEQFVINNIEGFKEQKKITFLEVGDKVKIVSSAGEILGDGIIEKEINSYIVVNGEKFWKKGIDGKHRKQTNYLEFVMSLEDAEKYKVRRTNMEEVENKAIAYVKEHFGDVYDWESVSMSKHTFYYELRRAFICGYMKREEEERE